MDTKHAIAFWYNLKGNYDVIVFDNKWNLNKYAKAYKEIFDKMTSEELTYAEFDAFADALGQAFWDNIIKVIDEVYTKDMDSITTWIDNKRYKIKVDAKLDYGV